MSSSNLWWQTPGQEDLLMRIRTAGLITGLLLSTAIGLSAQSLPPGKTVTDNGPRTYRFTVEYTNANTKGDIFRRQRLTADYTRGLPAGDVAWKNVVQEDADGATAPFGVAQKRDFMEGFRYHNDLAATLKPEFFKAFPPAAVFERNLVWDTGMIEDFGQGHFDRLKLNVPLHAGSSDDVNMPGVGVFHNRDIVLEWIGSSQRNGQACALIRFQALLNPVEIMNAGITLKGLSNYWGQIWVSTATRQIEYATINETVVGDLKLAGQDTTMTINVIRSGVLEPVTVK
jgi:hypothetical protein